MNILKTYIDPNSPSKCNSILNTLKWAINNTRIINIRFRTHYIQVTLFDYDETLYACNFFVTNCNQYTVYKLLHK